MEQDLKEFGLSEEELFSQIETNDLESEKITAPRYSYWHSVLRVFFRNKLNTFLLILLGIIIVFAFIYPSVTEYDPYANVLAGGYKHLSPSQAIQKLGFSIHNILGTGSAGQSTFDAVWYGAKISISMAFICAAINMTVGVVIGAIWGFSKKFDVIMIEIYNIIANVPYILLISVLIMLFAPSFWTLVFALTITGWLSIAFFIRTQVIIIRDREYNLASKCLGTSIFKIAIKNILPFQISVIFTLLASEVPGYISYEMFLAYIGMAIKEQSLGKLLAANESAMVTPGRGFEFWSPVILASIISLVLYIAGQNLGDASDPRTHM